MNTPSKWIPSRHTIPVSDADHDRLLRDAYRACRDGGDIRAAMAERVRRALDALEREERAAEESGAAWAAAALAYMGACGEAGGGGG